MKTLLSLFIVAGVALCAGCECAVNFTRSTCFDVEQRAEDALERLRNRYLAEQAWKEAQALCPGQTYSEDYACGFKAGYADYLYEGGGGEPPPFPPTRYWGVGWESPAGARAMADWNAGFRHGAAAAEASGRRELVVLPLTDDPPEGPPLPRLGFEPDTAPAPDGAEVLPSPRTVLPAEPVPAPAAPPGTGGEVPGQGGSGGPSSRGDSGSPSPG